MFLDLSCFGVQIASNLSVSGAPLDLAAAAGVHVQTQRNPEKKQCPGAGVGVGAVLVGNNG